jgi:uncharacterized caspase-like protein
MRKLLLLICLMCLTLPQASVAGERVALIIGNAAYQHVTHLQSPLEESAAVADALKTVGFNVTLKQDLNNADFSRALREFQTNAKDAEIALIYFGGHGMGLPRDHYLIPTDARFEHERDAEDESISLSRVITAINNTNAGVRLVIVDADRDNPFARRSSRSNPRDAVTAVPSYNNLLIAYSTSGHTQDGQDGKLNSYTQALLRHLTAPGVDVRLAFNRIREDVMKATDGKQQPVIYGSLDAPSLSLWRDLGKRVALVIGNTRYRRVELLENASNDAELIGKTLRNIGFESVTLKFDLTREQMMQALQDFADEADTADWAVIYYAGHGLEFGGANYLVPIDARLRTDRDIEFEAVDVNRVLTSTAGAKRLRLVILDACRSNPFASEMRRTIATRSLGRGLAQVEPEAGTLIAYAAKHGEVALDGQQGQGPFAEALAKRIAQKPAIEVRRLFDFVRDDVLSQTGRRQQPFTYGSLSGTEEFYFLR